MQTKVHYLGRGQKEKSNWKWKSTSHSTIQDQVMLIWENEIQVFSLEMLHVNFGHTKQQQGHCWQPAPQTPHPSRLSDNQWYSTVSLLDWVNLMNEWRTYNQTIAKKRKMCAYRQYSLLCEMKYVVLSTQISSLSPTVFSTLTKWTPECKQGCRLQSSDSEKTFHTVSCPVTAGLQPQVHITVTPTLHLSVSSEIKPYVNGEIWTM